MTKITRSCDKSGANLLVAFVVKEDNCPGLQEFLGGIQGNKSNLPRAIVYKWFFENEQAGTLATEMVNVLGWHANLKDKNGIDTKASIVPPVTSNAISSSTAAGQIGAKIAALKTEVKKSKVDLVRELFDQIEDVKKANVPHKAIVSLLKQNGISLTTAELSKMFNLIRRERALERALQSHIKATVPN